MEYGININVRHPVGQPDDVNQLKEVAWVRYVFSAAASHESIEEAFATYDATIERYNSVDVRSLIILNQETFWGHGPWDNGDWERYAADFAAAITPIVQRYAGKKVAYEVWNEGDIQGHSSIYVPPADFAKFLGAVGGAIRTHDPDAPIIFGGLAAGAGKAAPYVQAVKQAMGGNWPVDAIGIHPYGQWTPNFDEKPTWGGWFGNMADYMNIMQRELPDEVFWMTEIGVSETVNFPPDQYPMVQRYMQGVYDFLSTAYAGVVQTLQWFAWSDVMRQAGIVDSSNNPKGSVYDQFMSIAQKSPTVSRLGTGTGVAQGFSAQHVSAQSTSQSSANTQAADTSITVRVLDHVNAINVRDTAGSSGNVVGTAPAGTILSVQEDLLSVAAKIGLYDQWVQVQLSDGKTGWIAAWYVVMNKVMVETPEADGLLVRSGPDTSYPKIGSIMPDTPVQALEPAYTIAQKLSHKDDNWLQVGLADGVIGWSYAPYLQLASAPNG